MLKDRLKQARLNAGLTLEDVAKRVGVSRQTIHRYESGVIRNIPSDNIEKLASILGTTPEYLMGWKVSAYIDVERNVTNIPHPPSNTLPLPSHQSTPDSLPLPDSIFPVPGSVRIPVLGRIVAGEPTEALENIIDYVEISKKLAKCGQFFALQIKGASMEPTLHDGDIVIVRHQEDVATGEIAIVLINGNDATVKEVKESEAGLTLIGHNVAVYSPHFYSWVEVKELPIQIIGKVVELRRKL